MNIDEMINYINKMKTEKCKEVLLKYVETCTKDQREGLWNIMMETQQDDTVDVPVLRLPEELLQQKLGKIREWIERIESGELYLEASGYEDYTYGYWDSEWTWVYEDPFGIEGNIKEAFSFAEDCVNYGHYNEAREIYELLLSMDIRVSSEYDYCEPTDLDALVREQALHVDLKSVALRMLYAIYQTEQPTERAEKLYSCFQYDFFWDIRVQDMLSVGREELLEQGEFWDDWIALLEKKSGETEGRLLKEAILFHEGATGMAKVAARNYETHPALALATMEEYKRCQKYFEMAEFGLKTLEEMNSKFKVRSEVALYTAFALSCIGEEKQSYACCFEAFRSDTTVKNYLRLYATDEMATLYKEQIESVISSTLRGNEPEYSYGRNTELRQNYMNTLLYCELQFYAGNFEFAKKESKNPPESLGWTGKFIRTGIELFLLYLYDEFLPTKSMRCLSAGCGFRECAERECLTNYEKAIVDESERLGVSVFWNYFQRWKGYHPMSAEEKEIYFRWAEKIVFSRADAIVGGQFRNHYGSVAVMLAALGDIKQSWGDFSYKQQVRAEYKRKFPRHSSFQGEMREYFGL